ncbi:unnamed protein product [Lupinus luteus]|uniref:Ribosomal protein S4 n=1 Tax=Lupinus luteus TaxID=3873 RepID=A0AAV1W848_LUPLU
MYHKRGLWAIKAKNGGVLPRHEPKVKAEAPIQKAPKFYLLIQGKESCVLKQLPSGFLLVNGPFKINGVPLRRVNQAYVIGTQEGRRRVL